MREFVVEINFERNGIKEEHKYTFTLNEEEKKFINEIAYMFNYDFNTVLHYLVDRNLLKKLKKDFSEKNKQMIINKFADDMFKID